MRYFDVTSPAGPSARLRAANLAHDFWPLAVAILLAAAFIWLAWSFTLEGAIPVADEYARHDPGGGFTGYRVRTGGNPGWFVCSHGNGWRPC